MFRFFKQYAEWFVLGLTFLVVFLYYFFSPGVYGSTDNVTHFLYSRYAFQYPVFFLHPWARPLYTILSAPFAQFGFKSVQLLNVLLGMATAYYCYRIAKILDIHPSLPVILFVCFMPLYFIMMPTALTEILFSFVLVISFFLFLRRYFVAAAVVISFLPFARSEGFFLLPFYFLAFLYVKKYRAIPFLVVGTLLFSLAGWHYYKDFFWVFTQFPYQLHHPIYNQQGDLLHFLIYRDEIIGLPLEILFIAGTLQVTRELFSGDRALRDRTVILCLLSLTPIYLLSVLSFFSLLERVGRLHRTDARIGRSASARCDHLSERILDAFTNFRLFQSMARHCVIPRDPADCSFNVQDFSFSISPKPRRGNDRANFPLG